MSMDEQVDPELQQLRRQELAKLASDAGISPDAMTTKAIESFLSMSKEQKKQLTKTDLEILNNQMNILLEMHPSLQDSLIDPLEQVEKRLQKIADSQPQQSPFIGVVKDPNDYVGTDKGTRKYPKIDGNDIDPQFLKRQAIYLNAPVNKANVAAIGRFADYVADQNPRKMLDNVSKYKGEQLASAVYVADLLTNFLNKPGNANALSQVLYNTKDGSIAPKINNFINRGTTQGSFAIDQIKSALMSNQNLGPKLKQKIVNVINSESVGFKKLFNGQYLGPSISPYEDIDTKADVLFSQYAQTSPFDSSLKLNQNTLTLFPQWAVSQKLRAKRRQQAKAYQQQKKEILKDPSNAQMKYLASVDSTVHWNQGSKMWVGKGLKLSKDPQKQMVAFKSRLQTTRPLLTMQLTTAQRDQQIPLVVKDIVNANSNLSSTGFGPIGPNSLSLYAGRWIDPATGRIRVLPTADSKYINPLSLQQKKAYYQAKIINHWNNLVSDTQQYNKLDKMDQKQYGLNMLKKIKGQFSITKNLFQYCQFINNQLIARGKIVTLANNYRQLILSSMPAPKAAQVAKMKPTKDDSQAYSLPKQEELKIAAWTKLVNDACKQIIRSIDSDKTLDSTAKTQQKQKLGSAQLQFIDFLNRKVGTAAKDLLRATVIPLSVTGKELVGFYEKLDSISKDLTKFGKKITTKPLSQPQRQEIEKKIEEISKGGQPKNYNQAIKKLEGFSATMEGLGLDRHVSSDIATEIQKQKRAPFASVRAIQQSKQPKK